MNLRVGTLVRLKSKKTFAVVHLNVRDKLFIYLGSLASNKQSNKDRRIKVKLASRHWFLGSDGVIIDVPSNHVMIYCQYNIRARDRAF